LKTVSKNLALLRQKYLRLTDEHQLLQKKYDAVTALGIVVDPTPSAGVENGTGSALQSPLSRQTSLESMSRSGAPQSLHRNQTQSQNQYAADIIQGVQGLLKNPQFSDLALVFQDGQRIRVHKMVLAWRSQDFANRDLAEVSEIQIEEGVSYDAILALVKFLYLDSVDLPNDDVFLTKVMVRTFPLLDPCDSS